MFENLPPRCHGGNAVKKSKIRQNILVSLYCLYLIPHLKTFSVSLAKVIAVAYPP